MLGVFFEGVLRVYHSLYVGLSVIGLIFGEAIFLMRTSKSRGNTTSILSHQLILRYETLSTTPRPWHCWKAEDLSLLNMLLVRGVTVTRLLIKKRQS
jgi:hypothetical protein